MGKAMVRVALAVLIGVLMAPIAPAAAWSGDPSGDRSGSQARDAATPAVAEGDQLVLRRDGSKAVPFVADPVAASTELGFQWDDALIGAASACGLMLVAMMSLALVRRRREHQPLAGRPV